MTKRKPNYCPYCGTELVTREFDGRERGFCSTCQEFIFQNPAPIARTVVLDDEKALFVKHAPRTADGKWTLPEGFLEVDESAAHGAARELAEETNIRVPPEDLALVRTGHYVENPDEGSILSICFAAERELTTGTPEVGDEPTDVQFRDPQELLERDEQTRSVDLRCLEAAVGRLRGQTRDFSL